MEPQSIFDLSAQEFEGAIAELGLPQSEADQLRRQYRRQNSPFSGLYGLLDRVRGQDAEQGRVRADVLPMTRPEGMTGMEALLAGEAQLALPGGLLGAAEGAAMGIDAPGSAYQGMIPLEDMAGEGLGTAGMAMLGGGAAARPAGSVGMGGRPTSEFSEYLARVNPEDRRIPAENRPNLGMGDMYGMLPANARQVGQRDGVRFYESDGNFYATAYNPDVGEMDVVGYAVNAGDATDLQVVSEMQGRGIGGELQYLYRRANPDAPTGGLTEAGERSLARTYERLRDEGILSANRSAPTGAVGLLANESRAQQIARMLREGRGDEITEDMLAALDANDNMELADLYASGATGMDMPMDYESRMARAAEMGFGIGDLLTHGSKRDFHGFSLDAPRSTDFGWYGQGVSLAPNDPSISNAYAMVEKEGVGQWGGRSYPVVSRGRAYEWPTSTPPAMSLEQSEEITQSLRGLGYEMSNIYAPDDPDIWGDAAGSWREQTVYAPRNIRSRFARFDPRLRNSANLLAANASPELGLLAASAPSEQEQLDQLRAYLGLLAQ